ncbi:hypothetical protein [Chelatococcus reniformis]|uniref:Uncharacterized protein n=1 Tax=Chelatococcus reniformis TaxID=1494448 RepID=A0A916UC71_9HYPH|nr:hypothetical protein [Chelatococcus reniformis]GGC68331.1 hypothetical protein GCM10010994_28640 [Chelatococcus reniformis]
MLDSTMRSPPAITADIDQLWLQLLDAAAQSRAASSAYHCAASALPWWAAFGPKYLAAEGVEPPADMCGWPAIQDLEPPENQHAYKLLRPGRDDIERHRLNSEMLVGKKRAQAVYERHMAALDARLAAQKAEEDKVGLPELDRAFDAAAERIFGIEGQIEALPPNLERVVALTLINLQHEADQKRCFDDWEERTSFVALEALLPFISGPVAETARDLVEHTDRPFYLSPLSSSCREWFTK